MIGHPFVRFFVAAILIGIMTSHRSTAENDPLFYLAGTRAYQPPQDTVEIIPRIEIGMGGEKKILAAVFRPKEPSDRLRPGVVFIHGGGWKGGRHYNVLGAWLAERGYVVASIGYRLNTEAKWPAQIEDCKLGVRWFRANAAKYGVDPNRIAAYGTSAGGHLAACVGVTADRPEFEGHGGWEGISSKVQAVVALNPPTDLTGDWLASKPPPRWVEDLFGVSRESAPDLWKQASPALHVHPGAPPFFLAHGEDDTHVPFTQGQKLHDALVASGVAVEWIPVKNGKHGFFVEPTTPELNIDPSRETIMQRLLAFLDRYLKEPEAP